MSRRLRRAGNYLRRSGLYFDPRIMKNDRATIMDRDAFAKAAASAQRPTGALPLSPVPGRADAALRQARDTRGAVGQTAPLAPSAGIANPNDMVARALAILAEENELWQTRRAATPSPRGSR